MDFDDTPEEAKFRAECRAWLERNAELRPADEADTGLMDERSDPATVKRAQQWQAKKADGGWACITWPREVGGRGGTASQSVVWRQEESRYKTPPDIFAIGLGMLGPTLMAHGTDAQKQRYLRPMLRGEEIWCQLFSEPAAGSDLAGLNTRAVHDGDSWVLNGQKIWTTGAQYSRWGMVLTRTDFTAAKHAGITYFVVDMQSPGIEIRPIKQINGGQSFNQVFFTDVRIPHENVVGKVNDGWRGAITTLMNERASIGSGTGGPGFRDLLRLAKETDWNGRPALEDPAVRQRLAEFYVKTKGLQYTGYRTQTALSHGQTPGPEASIGKLVGAPLRQQMASFALELQGVAGTLTDEAIAPDDAAWQRSWLGAPGLRLAGGTDEILRNIVAERVLRLPGEPRMDKDLPFQEIPTGVPSR